MIGGSWICNELLIAVVIGHGDEQIEPWPDGSNDAVRLSGSPIDVTASYISSAMRSPSSGGLNQRERTNSDSLRRTSGSLIGSHRPVCAHQPDHRLEETICSTHAPAPRAPADR